MFDGCHRFVFVHQVLLQLPEQLVPLLSIQQDLLCSRRKKVGVSKKRNIHDGTQIIKHPKKEL